MSVKGRLILPALRPPGHHCPLMKGLAAMADNRPNGYWEDKKLIIRASSFGGCIRSLIQTGMGVTPVVGGNNYLAKAFAEGTRAEPLIVERLNEMGHGLIGTGEDQLEMELKVGPVVIRCHPD